MNVLVTGLFEPAALHAVRRFGELGYRVTGAEGHRLAYAGFSKHVRKRVRLPNMRRDPVGYAKRLLQEIETGSYDYYFPSFEEIILMSHFRERIMAATKTTLPDHQTLMRLHDKAELATLAASVGVHTPEIFVPASLDEAREYIATIDHPVVVKMRQASGAAGFRKFYTPEDIEKHYLDVIRINDLPESDLPIIQQLVEGPTTCTLELCNRGEVIGDVMYQGIRTMPRTGGTTVFRESMSDGACQDAAAKVVHALNFSGLCGFDFIMDRETGNPYLVDGNCRITPAVSMAYHGGCDMIEAWIHVANGESTPHLPVTKTGVRTKMQFGDFVWLLESYAATFKDWSKERKLQKAWWADKDFHYDISSMRDPMPIIMVWIYIITNCYKLIFTDFDSAQLFIYHNQYVERNIDLDKMG